MASGNRYRTDLIQFAVGDEGVLDTSFGSPVDCTRQIGLINSGVTLADPNYEWTPFYGVGVNSRDMTFPVQGREVLQGTIPNIMYCHDASRFLSYMGLGHLMIGSVNASDTQREQFFDADTAAAYILQEAMVLPSFTLGAVFRSIAGVGSEAPNSTGGTNVFRRLYTGCKVSRLTLNLNEGQPVMMNVDYIAQDVVTSDLGEASLNPKEGVTVPNVTMIAINEQPFFFSRALLTYHGVPFARFRSLTITIDNQLDPRYYLKNYDDSGGDGRQILSEILEGRMALTIRGQLDLDSTGPGVMGVDAIFLQHLLRQGDLSATSGTQTGNNITGVRFNITLERHGGDMTTIEIPDKVGEPRAQESGLILRSAPVNIAAPPAIHVPQDIDGFASSISMTITDV